MGDLKAYLTEKVLLFESDTYSSDTEKVLENLRRDRTEVPIINVSFCTSSIIAGSDKTYKALKSYVEENQSRSLIVKVGCIGPVNFDPVVCIQMPGKNKLFFRNITEEKVEPLLNGVFHNDINEEDLLGQDGSKGFELWPGIAFIHDLPFFARQKRVVLGNCGFYDPESIEEYIARGGYRTFVKTIRHYTFDGILLKSILRVIAI